jgi:hypothetical protein
MFGKHGKANILKLPMGVPRALVHVVDSDTDTDNRTCAMNCLLCMAAYAPGSVLADSETVACALRVVQEQGSGAHPVPPNQRFRCSLFPHPPFYPPFSFPFSAPPIPVQI